MVMRKQLEHVHDAERLPELIVQPGMKFTLPPDAMKYNGDGQRDVQSMQGYPSGMSPAQSMGGPQGMSPMGNGMAQSPAHAMSPHGMAMGANPNEGQDFQMQRWDEEGYRGAPYMVMLPPGMMPGMPGMPGVPGMGMGFVPMQMPMGYMPYGMDMQRNQQYGNQESQQERHGNNQTNKNRKPRRGRKQEPVVPPRGPKVFVGGLGPQSTSETLREHFKQFGPILDASVLADSNTRRSRGFGFVEFEGSIPDGVIGIDHIIGKRRCGVREYEYNPSLDECS